MAKKIEEIVPEGSTKIKFTRNTPYDGVDYGPDYETDTVFVESRQAALFIMKGRAVSLDEVPEVPEGGEG